MGYKFLNEGSTAELFLYSDIGWLGTSADQFRRDLDAIGTKPLVVRINSNGGDPTEATAIHSLLKFRNAPTTTRVDGIAASAATIITQAGTPREMVSNGWFMIHEPRMVNPTGTEGDARSSAQALAVIKAGMVDTYVKRTGKRPEEIQALMEAETWYTAEQAKANGFVDVIVEPLGVQAAVSFDAKAFAGFKNLPPAMLATFSSPIGAPPPVCGSSPQLLNKEKKSMSLITQCLQRLAGPSEREVRLATILTQAEFPPEELLAHKTDDGLKLLIEAAIANATAQERIQREIVQASLDALIAAMGSAGVKVDLTKPTEVAAAIQAHMDSIGSRKMVTLAASRGIAPQATAPGAVNGATAGAAKSYTQQCVEAA